MHFSDMEKLKIHAMFPDFVKPGFNAGINALISPRTWMKVKWNRPVRGFIWFHAFAFYCACLFDGGLFLSRRFSFPFSCGSGYHSVRYGLTRSSLRQLFEKYTDDPVTKLKPDCASQVKVSLIFFFLFCFFVSVFLTFVQQRATIYMLYFWWGSMVRREYIFTYGLPVLATRWNTWSFREVCFHELLSAGLKACVALRNVPSARSLVAGDFCFQTTWENMKNQSCWSNWSFRVDSKLRRTREDHISFPAGIWSGRNGVSRAQASDGGELQCGACRTCLPYCWDVKLPVEVPVFSSFLCVLVSRHSASRTSIFHDHLSVPYGDNFSKPSAFISCTQMIFTM